MIISSTNAFICYRFITLVDYFRNPLMILGYLVNSLIFYFSYKWQVELNILAFRFKVKLQLIFDFTF